MSNWFEALENLGGGDNNDVDDDNVDTSRDWGSIRENIKASLTESQGYYDFEAA
jgi:hypothetical protein